MKWSHDPLHRTYDAGRWINSSNTKSHQLLNVLTFFVEEGLPEEHLDDFLNGIVADGGWNEAHHKIRKTHEYGFMVHNLIVATAARRMGI
jgi:hypothetical protein